MERADERGQHGAAVARDDPGYQKGQGSEDEQRREGEGEPHDPPPDEGPMLEDGHVVHNSGAPLGVRHILARQDFLYLSERDHL